MLTRDVAAEVAELRRRHEEHFARVWREFPRAMTAEETRLRGHIIELARIDSFADEGLATDEWRLICQARVVQGRSWGNVPLDGDPEKVRVWAEKQRQTTIMLARHWKPGDAAAWRLRAQVHRMDRLARRGMLLPSVRRSQERRPRTTRAVTPTRRARARSPGRPAPADEPEPPEVDTLARRHGGVV
jgi:hypothetical protein